MSKKALYLLGIVVIIILGTFLYLKFYYNSDVNTSLNNKETLASDSHDGVELAPFLIAGSGFKYRTNENFKFLKDNEKIINPVTDSVNSGIMRLKEYLVNHPNEKVSITGFVASNENNTSTYDNLGLARANNIKEYFISQGVQAKQLDTEGIIIDTWTVDNDTVYARAEYKIVMDTN